MESFKGKYLAIFPIGESKCYSDSVYVCVVCMYIYSYIHIYNILYILLLIKKVPIPVLYVNTTFNKTSPKAFPFPYPMKELTPGVCC